MRRVQLSRPPSWAPHAAAALLLVVGWAALVRGAAHSGVPYRQWAFDHHAYSDILAMGGDRYFDGGRPTPYLDERLEYPPPLAAALWLPSFVSRTPWAYFTASYVALAALALASVWMLGRIPGASRWWFAGSPAIAYYTGLNWDQLPIALMLAAVLALSRGRTASAGGWAGAAVAAKLFPAALLPAALSALAARRSWRSIAAFALSASAAFLALNLPVALAAPERWAWFWRFNAARVAENSIWELLRRVPALERLVHDATFLNRATAALLAVAVGVASWGAWRAARRGAPADRAVRLAAALVLVAWIATNKVYSPQYVLYAVVAGALVSAPGWLFALVSAIAVVDYHVAFETRASRGIIRYFDAVYLGEEVVRTAIFALMAAWLARELWLEGAASRALAPPREVGRP